MAATSEDGRSTDDESFLMTKSRRASICAEVYDPDEDSDCDDPPRIATPKTDSQRQRLGIAIDGVFLFSSLERDQISQVIDSMREMHFNKDSVVFQQGDDGDNFYVIEQGIFDFFVDDKKVRTFRNNGCFGELALMYNMPRSATVMCTTNGTLWAMDRHSFRKIVLKNAAEKRRKYDRFLSSVDILQSLNGYQRMSLADALQPRYFTDKEFVFRQDDAPDGMYFVQSGQVRILIKRDRGGEEQIALNGPGTYFGELALLCKRGRHASVQAVGDVTLAFLPSDGFERLLGPCMDLLRRRSQLYVII